MALKPNPYRKRTPATQLRQLAPQSQPSPSPSTTTTDSLSPAADPHVHLPPPPPCGIQNLPSGTVEESAWRLPLPGDEVLEHLRESGFAFRPSDGNNIVLPEAEIWGRLVASEFTKVSTNKAKERHRPALLRLLPRTYRSAAPEVARRMSSAFPQTLPLVPQHRGLPPIANIPRSHGSARGKVDSSRPPVFAFLAALTTHYAQRNDELSPAFFAKLCLDYNNKAIDGLNFYVGVLRLLLSSGAGHLVEAFRPLLPAAWRQSDLTWLIRRVEEDVKFQMGIARARFAVAAGGSVLGKRLVSAHAVNAKGREELVRAVKACASGGPVRKGDSLVIVLRVPKGGMRAVTGPHRDTAAPEPAAPATAIRTSGRSSPADRNTTREAATSAAIMSSNLTNSAEQGERTTPNGKPAPIRSKKKVPRNGYRAIQVSHVVGIDESSSNSATTPIVNRPARPASPPGKKSLVVVLSPKATRSARAPDQPPAEKVKTKKKALPAPAKQPMPAPDEPAAKKVKTNETALPTSAEQPTLPVSSSPSWPPAKQQQSSSSMSLPSASTIPHVSPIYPTRRAILSRASKPYIYALCGVRFMHPEDVKRHHVGQGGRPGCSEKLAGLGRLEGNEREWDEDESCKVRLTELGYRQCREGWVVTDWGDVGRLVEGVVEDTGTVVELEGKEIKTKAKMRIVARKRKVGVDAAEADEVSESEEDAGPTEKRQRTEDDVARAAALGLRLRK